MAQRQIQKDCWYERANSSVSSRLLNRNTDVVMRDGAVWNIWRNWGMFPLRLLPSHSFTGNSAIIFAYKLVGGLIFFYPPPPLNLV